MEATAVNLIKNGCLAWNVTEAILYYPDVLGILKLVSAKE